MINCAFGRFCCRIVRNGALQMDSLGSLNAFVQAAEARSLTIAGRQLGVPSSAIGKAVAQMEERLACDLYKTAR